MRFPVTVSLIAGTALAAVGYSPGVAAQAVAQGSARPDAPGDGAVDDYGVVAEADEILVVATRLKGQVMAPQPPVATLDEEDIASYGAASISDLIAQISPQTGTGRGRGAGSPVVLINGQRISGFREMRNIPPEAILRLEVLPEEVALRYGYPPDQRVMNFVLKDSFLGKTVQAAFNQPDRGGTSATNLEASLFRVAGPGRLNVTVTAQDITPLSEADRGVQQAVDSLPTVTGDADPAAARSLVADSRQIGVNATWTAGLGEKGLAGSVTLNGALTRADSRALSGLNTVQLIAPDGTTAIRTFGDPLERHTRTDTLEGGLTFGKLLGAWQLTATVNASHAISNTTLDRRADTNGLTAAAATGMLAIDGLLPQVASAGFDRARSVNDSATSLVTFVGSPVVLPAGDVTATITAGFAWTGISASDTRNTIGYTRLHRSDTSAGINVGIPLTSRRNGILAGMGDISVNFSGGVNRLSDFGWLTDWSAGLTWGVTAKLGLQASYIVNQAAPGLTDLGNPVTQTFNVSVYDFTRGETALVTVISGGNADLARQIQRDIKLGLNWQLPFLRDSNLIVEYFHNNSDNVTASFPVLTPAIEAAFPGRVTRDSGGRLIAIDQRAVIFANQTSSRLRWGFNLGGALGKPRPDGEAVGMGRIGRMIGAAAGGGAQGLAGAPAGGGGRMGRGRNGQGRWNLSVYHAVEFRNRVLVARSGPALDLLGGDALTAGGVARHGLEFEGGAFYRGFGLRMNGSWVSPVHIRGDGVLGANDLRFGSVTKLNLRFFADLGQQKRLIDDVPFFKGARLSFKLDNVFHSRQRVTDPGGTVPLSYQADLIDPQGRIIGIEFRKQF